MDIWSSEMTQALKRPIGVAHGLGERREGFGGSRTTGGGRWDVAFLPVFVIFFYGFHFGKYFFGHNDQAM